MNNSKKQQAENKTATIQAYVQKTKEAVAGLRFDVQQKIHLPAPATLVIPRYSFDDNGGGYQGL